MKKIGVIANPNAGRKQAKSNVEELQYLLNPLGFELEVHYTEGKDHAIHLAAEMSFQFEAIIVMGGDGTVNEVVNGLMKGNNDIPLAIFPMGTINDFATSQQIPKETAGFARMLVRPHILDVDVGKAGEQYFLNVAAGGLLPELGHRVSAEAKTALGKFAYYMEGVREFPRQFFHPIPVEFRIQGRTIQKKILFFLAANGLRIGGFRNLVPEAKINDGLLDLLIIESGEWQDMVNMFLNMLRRQLEPDLEPAKGMSYYQVKEFQILSTENVDVDVDGELAGCLPMTFTVIGNALKIIVPVSATVPDSII